MGRIAIWACLGLSVTALLFLPTVGAERLSPSGGGTSGPSAVPVAVSNFPSMQTVTGTVAVGNFPRTVEVTGTVNVGNLPLDAEGNVRVIGNLTAGPGLAHFVGITQATVGPEVGFDPEYPILAMNRACHAEFSGTRSCLLEEIRRSIPPPPEWRGCVLMATGFDDRSDAGVCVASDGQQVGSFPPPPEPVACCGF